MSEVHKGNVSGAKGKKWTKESKEKLSKSKKGCTPWNKGLRGSVVSEETKIKISKAHKGTKKPWVKSGEDSPSWKGGISKIDRLCRRMSDYKIWRSKVFERDNWTCQTCGFRGGYVTAHHINGFSKIIKKNCIETIKQARECNELWEINNGVTLCESCHSLTDNYKSRSHKNI